MAAADVAQFLWKKFLRSLVDAESELSGSMNLFSYFEAIKRILVNTQTIPFSLEMSMPWNVSWEMNTYVQANTYLSELNYTLAECRIFANECRELNRKILPLNPSTVFFILKMKKRLTALKRKFVALAISISTLRERKQRNAIECLGFTEKDIVVIMKNSEDTVVFSDARLGTVEGSGIVDRLRLLVGGAAAGIGFTAIGIVGMAGVGKTTLVQNYLQWQSVRSEFSPIIQLCLSDIIKHEPVVDNTQVSISIVKLILEKLSEGEAEETCISGLGLYALLERLNLLLSGKKYLIFLDDVCHSMEFYVDLGYKLPEGEKIGDRLSHGLPKDCGGAVIVTSRITQVAQDVVGLPQNTLNKRLTTLKRKSMTMPNSAPSSISTRREGEERQRKAEEIVVVKKKHSKEIVVLPDVNAGRFRSEEKIKERLLVGGAAGIGFTAIGIVGIAGMGKSTFVHNVLEYMWFEFDHIVWLCLSDIIEERGQQEQVNATATEVSISIVACILEKLGHAIDQEDFGLGELLQRLHQHLSGKRYLIVLDDVWDSMEFYSDLCYKLPDGEKFGDRLSHGLPKGSGGAVIVTSRITELAQDMVGIGQNNLFFVPPLDREWCLMTFKYFISTKAERCGKEKRFSMSNWETVQKIENEILDQIGGLPSIAKALAELIVDKRISETDDNRYLIMFSKFSFCCFYTYGIWDF